MKLNKKYALVNALIISFYTIPVNIILDYWILSHIQPPQWIWWIWYVKIPVGVFAHVMLELARQADARIDFTEEDFEPEE